MKTFLNESNLSDTSLREPVKNYLVDFFRKGGTPSPRIPLAENLFAQKS